MGRKTVTISAIVGLTFATTLLPSGNDAVALAQATSALAAGQINSDELVPETPVTSGPETPGTINSSAVTFVAEQVVQPLATASVAPEAVQAGSLAQLVGMIDTDGALSAEMRCLAGAVYFEARGEPLAGQLAVAQVIINRTEDGRFPRSYCAVVAQPGQFSFMRGSQMPAIRTGTAAWDRAVAIARIAHQGLWESEAGAAVFFHAKYVRPGWSQRKTRLAQIDTHIFYR